MTDHLSDFLDGFSGEDYPAGFLQRYELLECVGRGQDGETLLVRDRTDGSLAVARCVRGGEAAAAGDEGEVLSRLSHPAIPRFLGRFEQDGVRCMVREYMEGAPLDELTRNGPLGREKAVSIAVQLCELLTYLHGQEPPVIHRDIKPQNVILAPGGGVRLIDFGISRQYRGDAGSDTVCLGTRSFAPPEQYGYAETDQRADIYALGVLLRYLLTGSTREGEGGTGDRRLDRVISRCTAFAPQDRYPAAGAVGRALRRCAPAHRKRFHVLAGLVLAAVCGLVLGFAAGRYTDFGMPLLSRPGVAFSEPLIEGAVRASLGVDESFRLTPELVGGVELLYLAGNTPCANIDTFLQKVDAWQGDPAEEVRGHVSDLSDLAMMPRLRHLGIAGNDLADVGAVAGLKDLDWLELIQNHISVLPDLSGLERLTYVGLDSNPLGDITPLAQLPALTSVNLNGLTAEVDGAQLESLRDEGWEGLFLNGDNDFYRHLAVKTVKTLHLYDSPMTDLSVLAGVSGLRELNLCGSRLTTLEGIGVHSGLEILDLRDTLVSDLTPLLDLPNLQTLWLEERQEPLAAVLADKPGLTIRYG